LSLRSWPSSRTRPARPCSSARGSLPGSSLGFTLLPYLTVIPALAALRAVQQLSTAEFVTAIIGLFLGLLLGLLVGWPLSNAARRRSARWRPSGARCSSGWRWSA
jgi:hypothetical protein